MEGEGLGFDSQSFPVSLRFQPKGLKLGVNLGEFSLQFFRRLWLLGIAVRFKPQSVLLEAVKRFRDSIHAFAFWRDFHRAEAMIGCYFNKHVNRSVGREVNKLASLSPHLQFLAEIVDERFTLLGSSNNKLLWFFHFWSGCGCVDEGIVLIFCHNGNF